MQNRKADKALSKTNQLSEARKFVYQRALFFGERKDIGPHEAMLQEVSRTAGIVAWLEDKLQRLSEDGVPEDRILAQGTKLGITPSVWMTLFQEERKHLVYVSSAAIKAGIAERQTRLAEEQGRMIAMLLMSFIHDPELGLTPLQLMQAPQLVRKHIAMLNAGTTSEPAAPATVIETTTTEATREPARAGRPHTPRDHEEQQEQC